MYIETILRITDYSPVIYSYSYIFFYQNQPTHTNPTDAPSFCLFVQCSYPRSQLAFPYSQELHLMITLRKRGKCDVNCLHFVADLDWFVYFWNSWWDFLDSNKNDEKQKLYSKQGCPDDERLEENNLRNDGHRDEHSLQGSTPAHEATLKWKITLWFPCASAKNNNLSLWWPHTHQKRTAEDWKKVNVSDESTFLLSPQDRFHGPPLCQQSKLLLPV